MLMDFQYKVIVLKSIQLFIGCIMDRPILRVQ